MRIAINAASAKMGGAVSYLTNFLRHLPPAPSGYEFFVFIPDETRKALGQIQDNIHLYPLSKRDIGGCRRLWWEQVTLRRFLKENNIDALFSTANFGMFHCPVRQIILVRNALYFSRLYQKLFLRRHGLRTRLAFWLRRWLIGLSVRHADVVMTPTRAMLDDLSQFVHVDERKALVNPYGVAAADLPPASDIPPSDSGAAKAGQIVRLIYVSLYSEHKNLTTLLKAMPLLNRNGARKFFLKTTANPAWNEAASTVTYQKDLALARQPEVCSWVEFLGPLDRQQTQKLYHEGDLFVFPSLCESFGHPLVEAIAAGLPILAADTAVNREVCGDAAVYFSLFSPEDLAENVVRVASNAGLRAKLVACGRERAAAHFRWEKHVQRLIAALEPRMPPASAGV